MLCLQCGRDNAEINGLCPACDLALRSGSGFVSALPVTPSVAAQNPRPIGATEHLAEAIGYATMGERFLAFLCDASVQALLVGSFLAMLYLKFPTDFNKVRDIVVFAIPIAYMSLGEFFFHRSVGKSLLRIQVRSDSQEPGYPSLFRILFRESLGKFLCWLFFGIGFMVGSSHKKKKTWADRMANTVVVKTGILSHRVKYVLALVLIAVNIGVGFALTDIPLRYSRNLADRLYATEDKIAHLQKTILGPLITPEPHSVKEYQQELAALTPVLDEYDRLLVEEQDIVLKFERLGKAVNMQPEIYDKINGLRQKNRLRQEIARLMRNHVKVVLAFDPQQQGRKEVLHDREEMRGKIAMKLFFPTSNN